MNSIEMLYFVPRLWHVRAEFQPQIIPCRVCHAQGEVPLADLHTYIGLQVLNGEAEITSSSTFKAKPWG